MKRFLTKVLVWYFPLLTLCLFAIQSRGEIGRLGGYLTGRIAPLDYPHDTYNHNLATLRGIDTCDIIVIGDSYSVLPEQAWYQYYIEQKTHQEVRTVGRFAEIYHPCAMCKQLIENGMIKDGSIVILEIAERHLTERLLTMDNDLSTQKLVERMKDVSHCTPVKSIHPDKVKPSLGSIANFYRNILSINKNELIIPLQLEREVYNSKKFRSTLFLYELDLDFMHYTHADYEQAKDNLIRLKELSSERGIQLLVMVAANRYNLYYDLIENNPYPADHTLEHFADLDSTWFLNTNLLLKPLVDKGVKDITLHNDTHWSIISEQIVGGKLADMILQYQRQSR